MMLKVANLSFISRVECVRADSTSKLTCDGLRAANVFSQLTSKTTIKHVTRHEANLHHL